MCGFVGVFNLEQKPVNPDKLVKMRDIIAHRGPDSEGIFLDNNLGLGFRRLSIIDLEAGHQPMTTVDGRYTIVFNGEIYNYLELRKLLVQRGVIFRTESDTEVLLQLLAQEGKKGLSQINGMFACAVWDKQKRELFVARDRIGIKPFYYYFDGERFVFGSEIKAIIADRTIKREPNYQAIVDYLSFMYVPDDKTFFNNIKKLLPGHCATVSEKEDLVIEEYWDLTFEAASRTESQTIEELRFLINDSVKLHLRSDVPVGCHLSGGLDSSTVSSLSAKHLQQRIKTFSGKFNESDFYDETKYAKIVAKASGTEYLEIAPDMNFFQDSLAKLIWHMDEPAVGPGIIPQFSVCQLAADNVKVVLGGQGGDEIFGGYTRYFLAYEDLPLNGQPSSPVVSMQKSFSNSLKRKALLIYGYAKQHGIKTTIKKIGQRIQETPTQPGTFEEIWRKYSTSMVLNPNLFGLKMQDTISNYDMDNTFNRYLRKDVSEDPFDLMLYHDIKAYLPGLLQVEDRTSMAVSLESRVPLLDYRIVEFAATIPSSVKVKGLEPKYIFKQAIKGMIPDEVLNRKDKKGFPTPINVWFKKDPQFVNKILLDDSARQRDLFNVAGISNMLSANVDFSWQLWSLLNVELWFKIFIDEDPRFVDSNGYIQKRVELA